MRRFFPADVQVLVLEGVWVMLYVEERGASGEVWENVFEVGRQGIAGIYRKNGW